MLTGVRRILQGLRRPRWRRRSTTTRVVIRKTHRPGVEVERKFVVLVVFLGLTEIWPRSKSRIGQNHRAPHWHGLFFHSNDESHPGTVAQFTNLAGQPSRITSHWRKLKAIIHSLHTNGNTMMMLIATTTTTRAGATAARQNYYGTWRGATGFVPTTTPPSLAHF